LPWSQQWRQRFEHRGERVAQRSGGAVDAEVDEDEFADGAFDQGADRGSVPDAHDEVAFLTVQGVVEARRVLIVFLGQRVWLQVSLPRRRGSVTAYWEWPPAVLLVAGPLIETRADGSLGKDVPAWLPLEENTLVTAR
jgi:hypothetical protein